MSKNLKISFLAQFPNFFTPHCISQYSFYRAVFTWLSKGIGFGFGFGFTTPFGWLVYLLWFWFYDSQVKTALCAKKYHFLSNTSTIVFMTNFALLSNSREVVNRPNIQITFRNWQFRHWNTLVELQISNY